MVLEHINLGVWPQSAPVSCFKRDALVIVQHCYFNQNTFLLAEISIKEINATLPVPNPERDRNFQCFLFPAMQSARWDCC